MIKRHMKIILICMLAIFTLTGCNTVEKSENYYGSTTDEAFTLISSGSRMSIYKENVTDVMYVVYHAGYKGGLTVMLDMDSTPLLYSEWIVNKR